MNKQALQMTLKTKGRLSDIKEFENIIIRSNMDGSKVRIKDIARVELGADSYMHLGKINGKPAAMIMVSQLSDANILNLSKAIRAKVPAVMKNTFAIDVIVYTKKMSENTSPLSTE